MNIQIFGKSKCFDTKKAERYFKERRIPFQSIDLKTYGMSGREFDSVLRAVGGIDNLIDWDGKSPDITLMKYMDDTRAKHGKKAPPCSGEQRQLGEPKPQAQIKPHANDQHQRRRTPDDSIQAVDVFGHFVLLAYHFFVETAREKSEK